MISTRQSRGQTSGHRPLPSSPLRCKRPATTRGRRRVWAKHKPRRQSQRATAVPAGPGPTQVMSITAEDAHRMTWCCIQKLCFNSGRRIDVLSDAWLSLDYEARSLGQRSTNLARAVCVEPPGLTIQSLPLSPPGSGTRPNVRQRPRLVPRMRDHGHARVARRLAVAPWQGVLRVAGGLPGPGALRVPALRRRRHYPAVAATVTR
jgi:hypothetical protein